MSVSNSTILKSNHAISIFLIAMATLFTFLSADEFTDQQYQIEVIPQWYSIDNYVIQGPIGVLRKKTEVDIDRFYTKPSISYSFNTNWSGRAGFHFAYNSLDKSINNVEVRPYLGLNYYYTLLNTFEPISLNVYLRAEDRVRYNVETWDKISHFRARLKVSGIYDFNYLSEASTWQRAILSAELLRTYFNEEEQEIDLDENFEVETRVSLGLERTLADKQKIRFEFSWRYQVPFSEISNTDFHVFAFKVSYFPVWGDIFRNRLFKNVDE